MSMRKVTLSVTTDASGDATTTSTQHIMGKLFAIDYFPGSLVTGADLTITCEGVRSRPLLTKADAGISNLTFYPREIPHAVTDGAPLTATAGGDRVQPLLNGLLKIVVAQGGATKTGSIVVYYED